jgi:uncharacterized protein
MRFARCRAVSIALVFPFLFPVLPAFAQEPSMPTISVVGEGIATATSDMAVVTVGVVSQAPLAADALAQNSKLMTEVIATAKKAGIEVRDIATSRISLQPQYSRPGQGTREAPRVVAYQASNDVSIRVRSFDKLGGLLDNLVTSGANQIRGVDLTVADPEPLRDEARAAAMKDAIRKAEMLAEAAGVRIVRLFSASENVLNGPRPMAMRMAMDSVARPEVPIEAGEQEIRGRVSAVFEIAPK